MTKGAHQLLCLLGLLSFFAGFVARRQAEKAPRPPAITAEPAPSSFTAQEKLRHYAETYTELTQSSPFHPAHLATKEEVLWKWLELDGPGALRHVQANHDSTRWDLTDSPQAVLQRWTAGYPLKALPVAEGLGESAAVGAILDRLTSDGQLSEAISKADEIATLDLAKGGGAFLKAWAEDNPVAAGKWLGSRRHPQPIDLSWMVHYSPSMVLYATEALHHQWGRQDEIDALAIKHLAQVIQETASEDPSNALAWLRRLSPALLDVELLHSTIRGWATQSPMDALTFLEFTPADFQPLGQVAVVQAWSKSDPESAANWILSKPIEERDPFLSAAAKNFMEHDLAWANEILQTGQSEIPEVVGQLVDQLAQESPETAAARLLDHLHDPNYSEAFSQLSQTWNAEDPERCARFVASLDQGTNRDGAVRGLVLSLLESPKRESLQSALTWIMTMEPKDARAQLTEHLMDRWKLADPDTYESALEQLSGTTQSPDEEEVTP